MKSIKKTKSSLHAAVLAGPITALLTLALGAGSALATDGAWGVNSSGNWSDATKWAGGINIADGVGATADLSGSVISSSNKTITMDSARTLGKVMLGASSRNLDIGTGSNILTLDDTFNAGTNPLGDNVVEITYRAGSGRNGSIGVPIELKNNLLISNPDNTGNTGILISNGLSSSNGNLTITNNSNVASRTKFNSTVSNGSGTISYSQTVGWTEFNNANTFTGTTSNVAGSMVLGNSLALQNSALDTTASGIGNNVANGNGLKIRGITTLTLGGLTGNKAFSSLFNTVVDGNNLGYGALTALTLNPGTGATNDYSGGIANGAAGMTLTKTGAGTQILSGTSTYTGATFVDTGTFIISTAGALGNTAVTVDSDAAIGGDGTLAGSLALSAGADFVFSVSNTLDVTGPVTFGGFGVADLVGLDNTVADGTYTLINGPVNMTNVSNVGFGNAFDLGGGKSAYLQAGSLELVVTSVPEPSSALLCGLGLLGLLRRRRS